MSDEFRIKRGDTSPSLRYALTPESVDLTGATVVFNLRDARTRVMMFERSPAVIEIADSAPTVRFDWPAGGIGVAGPYQGEFEVTYADGSIETFPNSMFIDVIALEDLG